MPELRQVPLALTEDALHLLSATHADLLSRGAPPRSYGRIRAGSKLVSFDAKEVRLEACFLRLISIVEAYLDVLCSELFREASEGQSDLFHALVAAAESRAATNWKEREEAFKSFHTTALPSRTSWKDLQAGIAVRNTIAHGLGQLTTRQRNADHRKKVESAGALIVDNRIRLSYDAVLQCLRAAKAFIVSVDSSIKRPTSV